VQLPELIDREEIRALLTLYVQCADTGRTDTMLGLFTDDAVMEPTGDPVCTGQADIRAYFERAGESFRTHMSVPLLRHHLSSIRIDLDGPDRAKTTSYFLAITSIGPDHWGRYKDELVRTPDGWRIAHRLLLLEGRTPDGWLDRHEAARKVTA
jgi:ketosteroid isomerase-like protein